MINTSISSLIDDKNHNADYTKLQKLNSLKVNLHHLGFNSGIMHGYQGGVMSKKCELSPNHKNINKSIEMTSKGLESSMDQ